MTTITTAAQAPYLGEFAIEPGVTVAFHGPITIDVLVRGDTAATVAQRTGPLMLTGVGQFTFRITARSAS